MRHLGLVLLLAACATPRGRVGSLIEAGWLGEACHAAAGMKRPPDALLQVHLAGAPSLLADSVPADRFASPTYGTDVTVARLLLDEQAPVAAARSADLALVGADGLPVWSRCGFDDACPEAWMREQLGLPSVGGGAAGSPGSAS